MLKKGNEERAYREAELDFDINARGNESFRVFSVPIYSAQDLKAYVEKIRHDSQRAQGDSAQLAKRNK